MLTTRVYCEFTRVPGMEEQGIFYAYFAFSTLPPPPPLEWQCSVGGGAMQGEWPKASTLILTLLLSTHTPLILQSYWWNIYFSIYKDLAYRTMNRNTLPLCDTRESHFGLHDVASLIGERESLEQDHIKQVIPPGSNAGEVSKYYFQQRSLIKPHISGPGMNPLCWISSPQS